MSSVPLKSKIFATSDDSDGSPKVSNAAGGHRPFNLGPYLVEGLVGKGKVGRVFRASHTELEFPVTLTVLPERDREAKTWSLDCMTKFTRDVARAKNVVHDNVVRPTDIGEENSTRYVAMEYVTGVSVQTILEREMTLDLSIACEIALQAAVGLRHIHGSRLVHRDIRPENLLLTPGGLIKITDLGMGRLKINEQKEMIGPADYVAPEVLSTGDADPRSDTFSLGCTVYHLLSGQRPFDGADRSQQPARLSGLVESLPFELVNTVHRMMAINPAERYQTTNDVVLAMCDWASDEAMPDLVAWHINTKNAGLAPAATFQELERRNARDTEKTMPGPEFDTKQTVPLGSEPGRKRPAASLIVGRSNGWGRDSLGLSFVMRTALIAIPVLCAVGAFLTIGSKAIDAPEFKDALQQAWAQVVPQKSKADETAELASSMQPVENAASSQATNIHSESPVVAVADARGKDVAKPQNMPTTRYSQTPTLKKLRYQTEASSNRSQTTEASSAAIRMPKRTLQTAPAIEQAAAKPIAIPRQAVQATPRRELETREVAVRSSPAPRSAANRTTSTKTRSPYAGLRRHGYHAKLLKYLNANYNLKGGTWSLPPSESAVVNSATSYGHTVTSADIKGYDFTQSVQMQITGSGGAQWDAGYFVPEVAGINAGDRLLLAVWLKTVSSKSGTGKVSIFSEIATTNEKDIYVAVQPGNVWKLYLIPFEAGKGDLRRVGFHLAHQKQVIEFGGLALLNYGKTIPFAFLPRKVNGR